MGQYPSQYGTNMDYCDCDYGFSFGFGKDDSTFDSYCKGAIPRRTSRQPHAFMLVPSYVHRRYYSDRSWFASAQNQCCHRQLRSRVVDEDPDEPKHQSRSSLNDVGHDSITRPSPRAQHCRLRDIPARSGVPQKPGNTSKSQFLVSEPNEGTSKAEGSNLKDFRPTDSKPKDFKSKEFKLKDYNPRYNLPKDCQPTDFNQTFPKAHDSKSRGSSPQLSEGQPGPEKQSTPRSGEQPLPRRQAPPPLSSREHSKLPSQLFPSDGSPAQPDGCASRSHDHPSLVIHVISYSIANGKPLAFMPAFNIDARNFATPKNEMCERYTGRDPEFANTLFNTADHEVLYQRIVADAKNTIRVWRHGANPPEEVAVLVGCKAGMHRSVAVAERLAKEMEEWHGPGVDSVRCLHVDLGMNWLHLNWRLKKGKQAANP